MEYKSKQWYYDRGHYLMRTGPGVLTDPHDILAVLLVHRSYYGGNRETRSWYRR